MAAVGVFGLSLESAVLGLAAPTASGADVPLGVTSLFAFLLVAMISCLALEEKLHAKKSWIVSSFALVALLLGAATEILPFEPVVLAGHEIPLPVYIPAIDWNVIAIILGASLFVDVASTSGVFTWIAIRLTKLSGGDPKRLLIAYGVMTVVFSAVLNNVTAMIIVGSLSAVSLKKLGQERKLLAFLLLEGLLTNIGGLLTLISSVPNILVGTAAGIAFVEFFLASSPFVVVATAATLWWGARRFDICALEGEEERERARAEVETFDENDGIQSRRFFWFSAVMLVAFIGVVASASVLPWIRDLGLGYVAWFFAGVLLLRYRATVDRFYKALDWDLLFFFAALFVVIHVMEHALVLAAMGQGVEVLIGGGETVGAGLVLGSAAVASSVTDNIPLAAMLAKILADLGTSGDSPLWWSVIFGANLGGNLTPIGSASTLVAVTIMHRHGLKMNFLEFVKTALPFAAMHLVLATLYVLVFLR